MKFSVIPRSQRAPPEGDNEVYLRIDHWDDFSYVTMFDVVVFDEMGLKHELGSAKIGFVNQTTSQPTFQTLPHSPESFEELAETYFSVGTDVEYYSSIDANLTQEFRTEFLRAMRDMVFDEDAMKRAAGQEVFKTSLLRSIGITTIFDQYRRVLAGEAPLTDFKFDYARPAGENYSGIELSFTVKADSKPSTNIHAIIGRNGVGKTTLLNDMIDAIMQREGASGMFFKPNPFNIRTPIPPTYFSSLVSVSFSAFDPFDPPKEQMDPERGIRYSYVGLKVPTDPEGRLKSLLTLRKECLGSLGECFADSRKKDRWVTAIGALGSDENFAQMDLADLARFPAGEWTIPADRWIERMSAGHALVLLTISKLVARVEEKTIVLLDEPESHLHPPLLSAFTRALSQLLHSRNGLAIVATHSPVVLQEVPQSCVTVITRAPLAVSAERPGIETFGENVGVLTREVFGLEVSRSGFHALLEQDVQEGGDYESILAKYNGQLGQEAKGILRAMVFVPKMDMPER